MNGVTRVVVAVGAAALLTPALAGAAEVSLGVERRADAIDCPDAATLAEAVNENLGREAATTDDEAATRLEVVIEKRDGYRASIEGTGLQAGHREIADEAATCRGLAAALTVTVSMIAEGESVLSPSKDVEAPEPVPAPAPPEAQPLEPAEPTTPSAPQPSPVSPPEPPARRVGEVDAGAGGHLGLLDRAGLALRGDVRFRVAPRIGVATGVLALPRQRIGADPGRVTVRVLATTIRGCGVAFGKAGPPRIELCAHAAVGRLRGEGTGFDENRSASRPWLVGGGGVVARGVIVGPLEWSARLVGLVLLQKEGFSIDGLGTVYDPSPAGGFVTAGLGIPLW